MVTKNGEHKFVPDTDPRQCKLPAVDCQNMAFIPTDYCIGKVGLLTFQPFMHNPTTHLNPPVSMGINARGCDRTPQYG